MTVATSSTRPRRRAADDELLDLRDAGPRVGYSPQYLRKLWWSSAYPPPLIKAGGRFRVWASDIDRWAADYRRRYEQAS
jgi:hypothetical protein